MCGYCPRSIFKQNEVYGKIHMIDGKPACAVCRVMKFGSGHIREKITLDRAKYEEDIIARNNREQDKADKVARRVAYASQIRAREYEAKTETKNEITNP
jgi:hypothetical protein